MAQFWENDPIVEDAPRAPVPAPVVPGARRDPWDEFSTLVSPAPQPASPGIRQIVGPTRQPTPQTGAQQRSDMAGAESSEYRAESQPVRDRFSDESSLRNSFTSLPQVRAYTEVVPLYISARNAADTKAGDLNLVYAFGKIMDPGSVVREGEQVLVQGTGTVQDRLQGLLAEIDGTGRLGARTRQGLIAELRSRRLQLAQSYAQARDQHIRIAREYGFNPANVVGQHPAEPYAAEERARAGASRGEVRFFDEMPDGFTDEQRGLLREALRSARTADDVVSRAQELSGGTLSLDRASVEAALEHYRRTGEVGGVTDVRPPDISDVRGQGGIGETADAYMRTAANAVTAGVADRVAAVGDTIFSGGTYDENLRRQRAITDYDWEEHPQPSGNQRRADRLREFVATSVRGS